MYFILERGHFQLCQITGGDSHSCFDERIGISLFDHSGHLNVDSLRNFITEDRRVAILRCYGLYTLHIFTPQVFDYSRCSVAVQCTISSYWSTSPWAPPLKLYSKKLSTKPNLWNFQFPMVQMLMTMSFWSALYFRTYFQVAQLLFRVFFGELDFSTDLPVEWPVSRIVLVWLQQLLDLKSWKERWNQAFGFR